jgi:hypothetical protein
MARWQVEVPATAARRVKACETWFFGAESLMLAPRSLTLAPTVPIQPA